jgi:hypothetical protein
LHLQPSKNSTKKRKLKKNPPASGGFDNTFPGQLKLFEPVSVKPAFQEGLLSGWQQKLKNKYLRQLQLEEQKRSHE